GSAGLSATPAGDVSCPAGWASRFRRDGECRLVGPPGRYCITRRLVHRGADRWSVEDVAPSGLDIPRSAHRENAAVDCRTEAAARTVPAAARVIGKVPRSA